MLKSKQNKCELIKYFMLDFLNEDGTTPDKCDMNELKNLIATYQNLIEDKQLKELFAHINKNLEQEFKQNELLIGKEASVQKYAQDMLEVMSNFSACTNSKKLNEQKKETLIFTYLSLHSKEEPNL